MPPHVDPDARWRDPRQYGPSAEVLFHRYCAVSDSRLLKLEHLRKHIDAVGKNSELECDPARARRLYAGWIVLVGNEAEDMDLQGAFLAVLLEYTAQAAKENDYPDGAKFGKTRDAFFDVLQVVAALEEKPLGQRPDFTGLISAEHPRFKKSWTHLAGALLFREGYIHDLSRSFGPDHIFETIFDVFVPADRNTWTTAYARYVFESAAYYKVHGGPTCEPQIVADLSAGENRESVFAYRFGLDTALKEYMEINEKEFMKVRKEGWTTLNLTFGARKQIERQYSHYKALRERLQSPNNQAREAREYGKLQHESSKTEGQ